MKKLLTLFTALLVLFTFGVGKAGATTVTYAQSSTSAAAVSSGTAPTGSSVTFVNTYSNNKEQITKSNTMTLTLKGYDGLEITGVSVSVHNNQSSGNGSGSLTINGESKGSLTGISGLGNAGWTIKDFSVTRTTVATNGTVVIVLSCSTNSVFCNAFTITYETPASVATPTLNKESGNYFGAQTITVSNYDEDLMYFYTTDGTTPAADANLDPTGTSQIYDNSNGITISSSCTLKVIAYNISSESSNVASANYTILYIEHAGTEADPYTIADARVAIDYGTSEQKTGVYVAGIISQVDSYNSTNHTITYWISEDGTKTNQFEIYAGKGLSGADFSAKADLKVGDEVVVTGNIKLYNTTYEFDSNNQLTSLLRTPNFTIANVANLAEGNTLAIGDLTINKGGSAGDVTLSSSSDETVVKIIGNSISAEGAGDATITAILAANGIYKEKSTTFTVHVYEPCTNFLTLSQGTPTHGSFEMNKEEGEYPTCEAAIAVIITPEADERYHVQSVSATTGETGVDNGNGTWTITFAQNFNNASEINVTFEEDAKSTVTWNVNGDESLKTTVYNGDKPVFPATPSAIDATSTTFYGWGTAAWNGKLANLDAKTVYTKASNMPSVSGDVTYYAVFVKVEGGEAFDGEHGGTYKIYALVDDTKYYAKDVKDNKINSSEDVAEAADFEIEVVQGGFAIKLGEDYIKYNSSTDIIADAEPYTWSMATGTKGTWRVNSGTTGRALLYRAGSTKKFGGYATSNVTAAGEYYDLEIATATSYSDFVTTTYAINCAVAENGSVSADKASACAGETVTLTLTPDAGYKVASVAVNGGDPLDVTENQATFVMPAAVANVVASFSVATAIDNTEVVGSAVKVLRNGVLYIEKNGHTYNAMGQVIK